MPAYTLRAIVEATDPIFSVRLHPEGDDELSLQWHRENGLKRYTSFEFNIEVTGNFDYKTIVGARDTTQYTLKFQGKSAGKWTTIHEAKGELKGANKHTLQGSFAIPSAITTLPAIA